MKDYIISIAAAAAISAAVNIISPARWEKYVGLATGLVIVMCIAGPIFSLTGSDIFEGFGYSAEVTAEGGEELLREEIRRELENRVAADTAQRLRDEFGRDCTAEVEAAVNGDGEIEGIGRIRVYGDKIDAAALGRLHEVYGAAEVTYEGDR